MHAAVNADVPEARVRTLSAVMGDGPLRWGAPLSDRAAWANAGRAPGVDEVLRRAESWLTEPLPEMTEALYREYSRTGNRTTWERVSNARRARIAVYTLAEGLENEGRFLPRLEEAIRSICEEKTWVMPAHDAYLHNIEGRIVQIDLGAAMFGFNLACSASLLGDRLSPEVRTLVREHLERRLFTPFRAMVEGRQNRMFWFQSTHNWNAVCLAGVTGAALVTLEDPMERAFFAAAAEQFIGRFLMGFTADGYCSEGLAYWNYGFAHFCVLTEVLRQATSGALDLFDRPDVLNPALYPSRLEIVNGIYPAFSDCPLDSQPNAAPLRYVQARLGMDAPDRPPSLNDQLLYLTLMQLFSAPWEEASLPEMVRPAESAERHWFDQAGVLVVRPAEGTGGHFGAAMKGGHNNEHHNHNDVGSYAVVAGRTAVLVDPGLEVYTARTFGPNRYDSQLINSHGHPVPRPAGALQRTGAEARARVLETDFTVDRDRLTLDLTTAYEVASLRRLVRRFVFDRTGDGSLVVEDSVMFATPQSFETALITFGNIERLEETLLCVSDGDEAVQVRIDTAGAAFHLRQEAIEENTPEPRNPLRLGIVLDEPSEESVIRLTITPVMKE